MNTIKKTSGRIKRQGKKAGMGLLILLYLSSCTTVPFTNALVNRYSLDTEEVKDIQYYVSNNIVLRREVTGPTAGSRAEITPGHTLKRIEGKYVEEIIVRPNTPCVIVKARGNDLYVAFEEGATLKFSLQTATVGERKAGRYYLQGNWVNASSGSTASGSSMLRNLSIVLTAVGVLGTIAGAATENSELAVYFLIIGALGGVGVILLLFSGSSSATGRVGTIPYDGESYNAISSSFGAHLLVNEEALRKLEKDSRVLPGIKLD